MRLIPNTQLVLAGISARMGDFLANAGGGSSGAQSIIPVIPSWRLFLLSLGLLLLVAWIIHRLLSKQKFSLDRTPARDNNLNLLHLLFIVFLMLVGMSVAGSFEENSKWRFIVGALGQIVIAAAVIYIAAQSFRGRLKRGLGVTLRRWKSDLARGVIGYLAIAPVCFVLLQLMAMIPDLQDTHPLLEQMDMSKSPFLTFLFVFVAVVVAPLSEELLFRGMIQSMIRKYMKNAWIAIIVASTLFAMLHPLWSWPALFVLAVAMGYNYERCGRLMPSILIHSLFNAVACIGWLTM